MSRNLLAKSRMADFCSWLDANGIARRPGRGDFQVLQVKTAGTQWGCVYDRPQSPVHFTVTGPMESIVRRFIRETRIR